MHGTASTSSSIKSGFSALLLSSSMSFSMFSLQRAIENQHSMQEQQVSEGPNWVGLCQVTNGTEPEMLWLLKHCQQGNRRLGNSVFCNVSRNYQQLHKAQAAQRQSQRQHKDKFRGSTENRHKGTGKFDFWYLMAYLQARWQISVMSAPEKPLVYLTSSAVSTSSATGDLRSTALKIWVRLPSSGKGM